MYILQNKNTAFKTGYATHVFSAQLAGIPFPSPDSNFKSYYDNGYRWIMCLDSTEPIKRYNPAPLQWLEMCIAPDPYTTVDTTNIIIRADKALDKLRQGEGVIVHCSQGINRTGAHIAAILHLAGISSQVIANNLYDTLSIVHSGWITPKDKQDILNLLDRLSRDRGELRI